MSFVNVTDDLVITALYLEKIRYYIVNFYDYDGTLLKSESVIYGSNATAPTDPVREANPEFTYTFDGWTEEFNSISSDIDTYAVYLETTNQYLVTFQSSDGFIWKEEWVDYGMAATAPLNPTKEETGQYYYVFDGWIGDKGRNC